jgi:hypothetical protein
MQGNKRTARMNLFLSISDLYIPAFIKKRELKKLFDITAETFGCAAPVISELSFEESLSAFGRFTRNAIEQSVLRSDSLHIIQDKLFKGAFELGKKYKQRFHIKTFDEALEAGRILYRIFGIEFQSNAQGMITINSCFFSKYYSPITCWIISSLDEGIMAGLSGGGKLKFSQRITEGYDCCSARLAIQENEK